MASCSLQTCSTVLCVFGRMETYGQEARIRWDRGALRFGVEVRNADGPWGTVRGTQICNECLAFLAEDLAEETALLPSVRADQVWQITCTYRDSGPISSYSRPSDRPDEESLDERTEQ